jgi:hypothetical protein
MHRRVQTHQPECRGQHEMQDTAEFLAVRVGNGQTI